MPPALDIGAALNRAWDVFTKQAVPLIVGYLVYTLVIMVSFGLCAGPMQIGYNRLCLKALRTGDAEIGDVFSGFDQFGPAFLLLLLMGLGIGFGAIFCLVPGLLLAVLWQWAPWLMADGDGDLMSCLNRSLEYGRQNLGAVFVFVLVAGLISGAGGALGGLGQLVTAPIGMLMLAHGYDRIFGREQPRAAGYGTVPAGGPVEVGLGGDLPRQI